MSAPTLNNGATWAATWSFNVANDLAFATNAQALSRRVSETLAARGCLVTPGTANAPNPTTSVAPIRTRSRALVAVTATFRVNLPTPNGTVEGMALNLDAADAFKRATGQTGAGLGVERMAGAMRGCDDIGELFAWEAPVATVCADYRQLREGERATTGVSSALGSTIAAAGTGPVIASDNPALIGQRLTPHNGSLFDDARNFLANIPTEFKVAGGAALVLGAAVAIGYVRRSFA